MTRKNKQKLLTLCMVLLLVFTFGESRSLASTPTPKPKSSAKATPTPKPKSTAKTTPTPKPKNSAKVTPTPTQKNSTKTSPTPTLKPKENATTTKKPVETVSYQTILKAGFEDDNLLGFTGRGGGEIVKATTNTANSGSSSLHVSNRSSNWHGTEVDMTGTLKPGATYHVVAWVRYSSGESNLKFDCKINKNNGSAYLSFASSMVPKNTWTKMEGTIAIPNDTTSAKFYFEANSATDDFYVDDIVLSEVLINTDSVKDIDSLKEAYKGYFDIGSAVSYKDITSALTNSIIKHQFNLITMENEMKPSHLLDFTTSSSNLKKHKENAAIRLNDLDKYLKFAQDNGLKVRFHTLVWHMQTPRWFFTENYSFDKDAPLATKDLMLKRMENYIKTIMEYTKNNYPGVIYAWDVVNEAIEVPHGKPNGYRSNDSLWYQIIGESFVEKAFEFARKYSYDDAKLTYNDYNTYIPDKRTAIYNMVKKLKDKNLIDAIGMQSHIDMNYPSLKLYEEALLKYGELGLEIHVTELDIHINSNKESDQKRLATHYGNLFQLILRMNKEGKANITSVTVWGVLDSNTWLINHRKEQSFPLLFDKEGKPKQSFLKLIEVAPK